MLPKYASTLRYAMLCCATLYLSRPPIRTLLEHDTVEHTKVGGCVPDRIGYSLAPDVCIIRMRTSVTCGYVLFVCVQALRVACIIRMSIGVTFGCMYY
jgi:hypothetical protein